MKPMNGTASLALKHILVAVLGLAALLLGLPTSQTETPVQAWMQRHSNTTDSDDQAMKVITDTNGNVIIVGHTDDNITRKIFSSPNTLKQVWRFGLIAAMGQQTTMTAQMLWP